MANDGQEIPGVPTGGTTLTQVLGGLADEGYEKSFVVADEDGTVTCRTCGSQVAPDGVIVDGLRRLEGASDPGDMAAVLAVRCSSCDARGAVVVRYGPEAGPGDSALLLAAERLRSEGADPAEAASRLEPPPSRPSS